MVVLIELMRKLCFSRLRLALTINSHILLGAPTFYWGGAAWVDGNQNFKKNIFTIFYRLKVFQLRILFLYSLVHPNLNWNRTFSMLNFYEVKKNRTHRTLHFSLIKPDCPVQNRTPGNPTHNTVQIIVFLLMIVFHTFLTSL